MTWAKAGTGGSLGRMGCDMRLPLSKVWRAFPELDRFSDEQCRRFVRAARRGAGRVARVAAVVATLFVSWLAGGALVTWFTLNPATIGPWERVHGWAVTVVLLGMLVFATAPAILLRDRLLRRRIMRIITLRGRCLMCKYNLLGLPVGADLLVTCPECGATTHVDPALGELSPDQAGQVRFQPRPEQFPEYRAFFTPERVRTITRWSLRVFVTVLILTGAALTYHELRIRADARQAAADRAGPDGIEAFVAGLAKQAEGESVNGWGVMMEAYMEARGIQATVVGRHAATDPSAEPEVALIYTDEREVHESRIERNRKDRALGLEVLADAHKAGLFARLDRVAGVRNAVRPLAHDPDEPAIRMLVPEVGYIRHLARLNAARLHAAAQSGDPAEAGRALATSLSLARLAGQQPLLIDKLVGHAVQAMTATVARKAVMGAPSEALLLALQSALDAQEAPIDRTRVLAGERVFTLDTIRWFYADPANVRWGMLSAYRPLARLRGGGPPTLGRVPYYRTTVAQLDRMTSAGTVVAAGPRPPTGPAPAKTTGSNALLDNLYFDPTNHVRSGLDQRDFSDRALRALIAVERYRLAHGAPPPSLPALVPEFLAAVPLDPFCDLPLGYMLIDPATDEHGRRYLIFGAGYDGVQDLPSATIRATAIARWPGETQAGAHKDIVFNSPGD